MSARDLEFYATITLRNGISVSSSVTVPDEARYTDEIEMMETVAAVVERAASAAARVGDVPF